MQSIMQCNAVQSIMQCKPMHCCVSMQCCSLDLKLVHIGMPLINFFSLVVLIQLLVSKANSTVNIGLPCALKCACAYIYSY